MPVGPASGKALITLNVPYPYATGNDFPGGTFAISVNGSMQVPIAGFSYDQQAPQSSGRRPTTLTIEVPLQSFTQPVEALWQNVRNSTVFIDSPASLSAVVI